MPKIIAFAKNKSEPRQGNSGENSSNKVAAATGAGASRLKEAAAGRPFVTVVVPTCGRPQLLSRCLAGLVEQRFDPSGFEIIVVDDTPNYKTREVVIDWAEHTACGGPAIKYIASQGPHGPAAARNQGWHAARGSIIAFTDDDTVAQTDWLENGLRAFRRGDVEAAWGRIVMPLDHAPTDYELDAKNLERAEFVTANCFCLKTVLERLDGFDERFRFAWREDADLYFRLLGINANVAHVPEAVVVHPIRPAGWGVSLRQQRKILFDALLFKKHPELYRQKIRSTPRWDYYITVLALLACVSATVLDAPAIAAAAAGVWCVLTVRFCVMRLRPTVKTPAHVGEMIITSALIPPFAVFWRIVGAFRFRVRFV
jgi:GT2 family glycosyltransferase